MRQRSIFTIPVVSHYIPCGIGLKRKYMANGRASQFSVWFKFKVYCPFSLIRVGYSAYAKIAEQNVSSAVFSLFFFLEPLTHQSSRMWAVASELISGYADGKPIRLTFIEPKGWKWNKQRIKHGHEEMAITLLSCSVGHILTGWRHKIRLNYKEIGLHLIEIYRFRSCRKCSKCVPICRPTKK